MILGYYCIENHNGKYAQETTIKNSGSFWVFKERHQSCDGMRDAYIFIVNDMEPTYSEVH